MKRRMKLAALAAAAVLALPVFEGWEGLNEVKADQAGAGLNPREFQSTDPSNPNPGTGGSGGGTTAATPSTTPQGDKDKAQEEPGPLWKHEHAFEYVRIQEATETQDAVIQLQCGCGAVGESICEAGSSIRFFIGKVVSGITNAPENGTVTVDTQIWTCYNQEVIDALLQRPDVTLVTNYRYEHEDYTVTIPAGYEADTLLDENGYCGFRYLDQILGGDVTAEN